MIRRQTPGRAGFLWRGPDGGFPDPEPPVKTFLSTFVASISLALSAFGSQQLLLETTLSKHDAKGGSEVLGKPSLVLESGREGCIVHGRYRYVLTPTLRADGTVDIRAVITRRDGDEVSTVATPRMIVGLGKLAEVRIGDLGFTAQPSLAKKRP